MSFTVEVVTGLAQLLATAGVGSWTTSGSYADSDTAIVLGRIPLSPVSAIGLTPYKVPRAAGWLVDVTGVQVRLRAATTDAVIDLQDAVYRTLHHRGLTDLNGHTITDMSLETSTPVGALGDWDLPELADSYYLITDRLNPATGQPS